jgi:predicted nuclease of predicted toxin-antitoxin system
MKVKLDENLPAELASAIAQFGHNVDTVPEEGLAGRPDGAVWAAAQSSSRFFVTQDLDFADVREFAPGTHSGILIVRLATPSRRALIDLVTRVFRAEDVETWSVETWSGCFVVATDRKLRVRRASP